MNELIGVVGLIVGLIALPLTFWAGRRSRQRPELRYMIDYDTLVHARDGVLGEGLVVTADGQEITSIARTRLALWNNRGDTVAGTDVLPTDPLRIRLGDGGSVLQARVLTTSRSQCGVIAKVNPNDSGEVLLGFDFLDAHDGAVVEVIQQGGKPEVLGTIRGCRLSKCRDGDLHNSALASLAKSRSRRWLGSVARKRSVKRVIYALAILTGGILLIFWGSQIDHGGDQLADPAQYDLTTLEGQSEFARQVNRLAASDVLNLFLYAGGVAYVAVATVLLPHSIYRARRLIIPHSIAKVHVQPISQQDETSDTPNGFFARLRRELTW